MEGPVSSLPAERVLEDVKYHLVLVAVGVAEVASVRIPRLNGPLLAPSSANGSDATKITKLF